MLCAGFLPQTDAERISGFRKNGKESFIGPVAPNAENKIIGISRKKPARSGSFIRACGPDLHGLVSLKHVHIDVGGQREQVVIQLLSGKFSRFRIDSPVMPDQLPGKRRR